MAEIGVRELKTHTSEILRRVRDERETFLITYRGRVIARLLPTNGRKKHWREVWADMDKTAEEISKHWPKGVSAVEAVREQRR
jgi:prevent-host-death family protein